MIKRIALVLLSFALTSALHIQRQQRQHQRGIDQACCYDQGGFQCGQKKIDCCAKGATIETNQCKKIGAYGFDEECPGAKIDACYDDKIPDQSAQTYYTEAQPVPLADQVKTPSEKSVACAFECAQKNGVMCGNHNECCKKGGCHKDPIDHIDASYCLYGTKILLGYCANK